MEEWKGDERIFRTYIKGQGKKSIESHKGKDCRSFESASQFDSFGAELNEGFIDISFDTKEEFETFLDMALANNWCCLALESEHGGHSFWKDTTGQIGKGGKDILLSVGFKADIHGGATYIPLRVNGVDRGVRYELEEGEEYQEVPPELYPIKSDVVLWKMKSGDGRNEDLSKMVFTYHNQLKLSKEEIKRILKNVNDFVLGESLDESEIETILRDETFEKLKPNFFGKNGKFLIADFSEYLIEHYQLRLLNGVLCIYSDGVYQSDLKKIENIIRKEIPNISPSKRKEIIQELYCACDDIETADARYIGFKNGVLDIVTMELIPFNPELVVTNCIPWNYNPKAYHLDMDKMLNRVSCDDQVIRQLLEECIGYCFYRKNVFKKAFIFTGVGNNGKSTFLDCVVNALGTDNVSALDLNELGDRFSTAMLHNKLVNAGDDISDDFIPDAHLFKKITSGNRIKAEIKGQNPFEFDPYVKLIFCANNVPRIKDKTGAVRQRLVIVPFNAKFSETDPDFDPDIKYKLQTNEAMEYFIALGIQGLKRLLNARRFTKSAKVQKELEEYDIYNNPVLGFVKELEEDEGKGALLRDTTVNIYARYLVFCQNGGYQAESKAQFGRDIRILYNLESIPKKFNGKTVRMYVACGE